MAAIEPKVVAKPSKNELHCLPSSLDESLLLLNVFCYLDGYSVARLASVSKEWREHANDPAVWRECCAHVWSDGDHLDRYVAKYGRDFKRLFRERGHTRFDGVYLQTTEYTRVVERDLRFPFARSVKTTYWRYLHFRPRGLVHFALINGELPNVRRPLPLDDKRVFAGSYKMNSSQVIIQVKMPHITLLMRMELAENRKGAHNRLYMIEFRGRDKDEDVLFPLPDSEFHFIRERDRDRD